MACLTLQTLLPLCDIHNDDGLPASSVAAPLSLRLPPSGILWVPRGVRGDARPIRQKQRLHAAGHARRTAFFDLKSWMGEASRRHRATEDPVPFTSCQRSNQRYLGEAKLRVAALARPVLSLVLNCARVLSRSSAVSVSDCAAASTSSAWADISSTFADTS